MAAAVSLLMFYLSGCTGIADKIDLMVDGSTRINVKIDPIYLTTGLKIKEATVFVKRGDAYVIDPLSKVKINGLDLTYTYSKGTVPTGLDYVEVEYIVVDGFDISLKAFIPMDQSRIVIGAASTKTVDWFAAVLASYPNDVATWQMVQGGFTAALQKACFNPTLPYSSIFRKYKSQLNGIYDSAELQDLATRYHVDAGNLRIKFGSNYAPLLSEMLPTPREGQLNMVSASESSTKLINSQIQDLDGDPVVARWKRSDGTPVPANWITYYESSFLHRDFWIPKTLSLSTSFDDSSAAALKVIDLEFTICDGGRLQKYDFHVTVNDVNRAPQVTSTVPLQPIPEFSTSDPSGTTTVYKLIARDPDGDRVSAMLDLTASPSVMLSTTPDVSIEGSLMGKWLKGTTAETVTNKLTRDWPLTAANVQLPSSLRFKVGAKVELADYPTPGVTTDYDFETIETEKKTDLGFKIKNIHVLAPIDIGPTDLICVVSFLPGGRSFSLRCSHTHQTKGPLDYEWSQSYVCPGSTEAVRADNENCFFKVANAPDGTGPTKDQFLYLIVRPTNSDAKRGQLDASLTVSDYPRSGINLQSITFNVADTNSRPVVASIDSIVETYTTDPDEIVNLQAKGYQSWYAAGDPYQLSGAQKLNIYSLGRYKTPEHAAARSWKESIVWRKSRGSGPHLFEDSDYFYFETNLRDAYFSKIYFGKGPAYNDDHTRGATTKFDSDQKHLKMRFLGTVAADTMVYIPHYFGKGDASILPSDPAADKDSKQDAVCRLTNWFHRDPARYPNFGDGAIDINNVRFKSDPVNSDIRVKCVSSFATACTRLGCTFDLAKVLPGLSDAAMNDASVPQFDLPIERLLFTRVANTASDIPTLDASINFNQSYSQYDLAPAETALGYFYGGNNNSPQQSMRFYFGQESRWAPGEAPTKLEDQAYTLQVRQRYKTFNQLNQPAGFSPALNTTYGSVFINPIQRTIRFNGSDFKIGAVATGLPTNEYNNANSYYARMYRFLDPELGCRYLVRGFGSRLVLTCELKPGSTPPSDMTLNSNAMIFDYEIQRNGQAAGSTGLIFGQLPAPVTFDTISPYRYRLTNSNLHFVGAQQQVMYFKGSFSDADRSGQAAASEDKITMRIESTALVDAAVVYKEKSDANWKVVYNNKCLQDGVRADNSPYAYFGPNPNPGVYTKSFDELGVNNMTSDEFLVAVYPDKKCSTKSMSDTGIENLSPWLTLVIGDGSAQETKLDFSFKFFDMPYPPELWVSSYEDPSCSSPYFSNQKTYHDGVLAGTYSYGVEFDVQKMESVVPSGCYVYGNTYANGPYWDSYLQKSVRYEGKSGQVYCYGNSGPAPAFVDADDQTNRTFVEGGNSYQYLWNYSPFLSGRALRARANETAAIEGVGLGYKTSGCRISVYDANYDKVTLRWLNHDGKPMSAKDQDRVPGDATELLQDLDLRRRSNGTAYARGFGMGAPDGSDLNLSTKDVFSPTDVFLAINLPKPFKIFNYISDFESVATTTVLHANTNLNYYGGITPKVIGFRNPRTFAMDDKLYMYFASSANVDGKNVVCSQDMASPGSADNALGGWVYHALSSGSLHRITSGGSPSLKAWRTNVYSDQCVVDGELLLAGAGCTYAFTNACKFDAIDDQLQAQTPGCYSIIADAPSIGSGTGECFEVSTVAGDWSPDGKFPSDPTYTPLGGPGDTEDIYFKPKGLGKIFTGMANDSSDWRCSFQVKYAIYETQTEDVKLHCGKVGDATKMISFTGLKSLERKSFDSLYELDALNKFSADISFKAFDVEYEYMRDFGFEWNSATKNQAGVDGIHAPAAFSAILVVEDGPIPFLNNLRSRVLVSLDFDMHDVINNKRGLAQNTDSWFSGELGEGEVFVSPKTLSLVTLDVKLVPFVSGKMSTSVYDVDKFPRNISTWYEKPFSYDAYSLFQRLDIKSAFGTYFSALPADLPEAPFGFVVQSKPSQSFSGIVEIPATGAAIRGNRIDTGFRYEAPVVVAAQKTNILPFKIELNVTPSVQLPFEYYPDTAVRLYEDIDCAAGCLNRTGLGRGSAGGLSLVGTDVYASSGPSIQVHEKNLAPCLVTESAAASATRGDACPGSGTDFAAGNNNVSNGTTFMGTDGSGIHQIEVNGYDLNSAEFEAGTFGANGVGIQEGVPFTTRISAVDPNITEGSTLGAVLDSSSPSDSTYPFVTQAALVAVGAGGAVPANNLGAYYATWNLQWRFQDVHVSKEQSLDSAVSASMLRPQARVTFSDNGRFPSAFSQTVNFKFSAWDLNLAPDVIGTVGYSVNSNDPTVVRPGDVLQYQYSDGNTTVINNFYIAFLDKDRGDTLNLSVLGADTFGFVPGTDYWEEVIGDGDPDFESNCREITQLSRSLIVPEMQALKCLKLSFIIDKKSIETVSLSVRAQDKPWWDSDDVAMVYNPDQRGYLSVAKNTYHSWFAAKFGDATSIESKSSEYSFYVSGTIPTQVLKSATPGYPLGVAYAGEYYQEQFVMRSQKTTGLSCRLAQKPYLSPDAIVQLQSFGYTLQPEETMTATVNPTADAHTKICELRWKPLTRPELDLWAGINNGQMNIKVEFLLDGVVFDSIAYRISQKYSTPSLSDQHSVRKSTPVIQGNRPSTAPSDPAITFAASINANALLPVDGIFIGAESESMDFTLNIASLLKHPDYNLTALWYLDDVPYQVNGNTSSIFFGPDRSGDHELKVSLIDGGFSRYREFKTKIYVRNTAALAMLSEASDIRSNQFRKGFDTYKLWGLWAMPNVDGFSSSGDIVNHRAVVAYKVAGTALSTSAFSGQYKQGGLAYDSATGSWVMGVAQTGSPSLTDISGAAADYHPTVLSKFSHLNKSKYVLLPNGQLNSRSLLSTDRYILNANPNSSILQKSKRFNAENYLSWSDDGDAGRDGKRLWVHESGTDLVKGFYNFHPPAESDAVKILDFETISIGGRGGAIVATADGLYSVTNGPSDWHPLPGNRLLESDLVNLTHELSPGTERELTWTASAVSLRWEPSLNRLLVWKDDALLIFEINQEMVGSDFALTLRYTLNGMTANHSAIPTDSLWGYDEKASSLLVAEKGQGQLGMVDLSNLNAPILRTSNLPLGAIERVSCAKACYIYDAQRISVIPVR